ncbi:MAG: DUF4175 domain-containing protein, partial [Bacteroidia bacterium]|nr:DUF4175 domain-containing protein [Bacteroidia bacterium]
MANNSNYNLLIQKLDEFIRKFYKNQLIRGLIYSIALLTLFFISVTTFEYFAHLDTMPRTLLFYGFVIASMYVIGRFILFPLFKLYKLSATISHEQAARIIGNHFGNVEDKLLNILQLKKMENERNMQSDLINASIDQKIGDLKPVPFTAAIDLNRNKKYLRYLAVPMALLLVIVFAAPSLLQDGTKRLVNHRTFYERPAPFQFEIQNDDLSVVQQEDFRLNIRIVGDEVPDKVYLQTESGQFRLVKESTVDFYHVFKNVQKTTEFKLSADDFASGTYTLKALPNPLVLNFKVKLTYPRYLNRNSESMGNTGDLIIPAGTKVNWEFNTLNTDQLKMIFADTTLIPKRSEENKFVIDRRFLSHNNYSFVSSNDFLKSKDSILYAIHVIPDLYPTINVEQQRDSFSTKQIFFKGLIKDDYGFKDLKFVYKYVNSPDAIAKSDETFSEVIKINKTANQEQFFYYWDLNQMNIDPGDYLEYYFEVWDNDGVTGSKSARSQSKLFKAPSLRELAQ